MSVKSITNAAKPSCTDLKIWVCDNTTTQWIKEENKKACKEENWIYIDMKGNQGLSKAYNKALVEIPEKEWVILFDQDTFIPEYFFIELLKSIKKSTSADLHVPYVESLGRRISPSIIYGHIIRNKKNVKNGENSQITAINSGMAIHRSVFVDVGFYNEELFLDCIDHFFIRRYKKKKKKLAVFNCTLQQAFSGDDHSNYIKELQRFKIFKNDFYIFCMDSVGGKIYYVCKIFLRALKLSLIHKNDSFLKALFFNRA